MKNSPIVLLYSLISAGFPSVTVFNAYPKRNLAALITFGTTKFYKDIVHYGEFRNLTLDSNNYDYIIEYLKPPKADPVPEFTTYGYLNGYDENIQDSLIVISKDDTKSEGIQDTSILFEKVKDGLSRIYFFNALKKVGTNKGVYAYCLYDRNNYGGNTKSKSILQLANDIPYGKGVESVLLPNARINIKVFDQVIHSVFDFNQHIPLHNNSVIVQTKENKYNFIVLTGKYMDLTVPPHLSSRDLIVKKSGIDSRQAYTNQTYLTLLLLHLLSCF